MPQPSPLPPHHRRRAQWVGFYPVPSQLHQPFMESGIGKSSLDLFDIRFRHSMLYRSQGEVHQVSLAEYLYQRIAAIPIGADFVVHVDDGEICYMIDADFYNAGKVPVEGAIEKLDYFNKHASRLLRWCITDRLHQAMEPQAL